MFLLDSHVVIHLFFFKFRTTIGVDPFQCLQVTIFCRPIGGITSPFTTISADPIQLVLGDCFQNGAKLLRSSTLLIESLPRA